MPCSSTSKVSSASCSVLVSVTRVSSLLVRSRRLAAGAGSWSAARSLLRELGDLEGLRLLGLVRVLRAGVHLQLLDHLPAQPVLREHAPDRLLDGLAGVLLQQVADGDLGEAAGVAGVAVDLLGLPLVAGQGDLRGVDDDDEVTTVDVRG